MKMKGIRCCGDCGYYNWKKHKCTRATDEGDAQSSFYADCPLPDVVVAQEPVEPQEKREGGYRNLYCGACGCGIVGYVKYTTGKHAKLSNYCNKCGREVKWK